MVSVHHGGHTIKTETIKLIFLEPPSSIGEKKSYNLRRIKMLVGIHAKRMKANTINGN